MWGGVRGGGGGCSAHLQDIKANTHFVAATALLGWVAGGHYLGGLGPKDLGKALLDVQVDVGWGCGGGGLQCTPAGHQGKYTLCRCNSAAGVGGRWSLPGRTGTRGLGEGIAGCSGKWAYAHMSVQPKGLQICNCGLSVPPSWSIN